MQVTLRRNLIGNQAISMEEIRISQSCLHFLKAKDINCLK